MAKSTESKTTKTSKTSTKTSKKSSKSSKKSAVPKEETPVVEEPQVVESTETVEEVEVASVHDRIRSVMDTLKALNESVRTFSTETRRELANIASQSSREAKEHSRALARASGRKRKPLSDEDRAKLKKNGFGKPIVISEALCEFLGVSHGTEMARTDVTKKIAEYVREHNLADAKNGRRFYPDAKLSALLGEARPISKNGDEKGYTYFNLQTYMKPHFEKAASA